MSPITRSYIMSVTRLYSSCHVTRFNSSNAQLFKYQRLGNATGDLRNLHVSNYIAGSSTIRIQNTHTRKFSVKNSAQPGAPLPSQPPSSSLSWLLGAVLTIVLPFVTNPWGSLLKIKTEVDTVVETIEEIVDVVEKVAGVVDKVAEDISDDLPEGGKLKKMVDIVEDVAEETAKDAYALGEAIDKLQAVEEKLENIVETISVEGKELQKKRNMENDHF